MMAPVFQYKWQQWLFLSAMALFLILPVLPKPDWMDRAVLYRWTDGTKDSTWYFTEHTLKDKSDIDVLFIGPSVLQASINPLIIKDALRPLLGREPVVVVAGHSLYAPDLNYIILRDILQKRKVKMLVLFTHYQPNPRDFHPWSDYLWDWNLHHDAIKSFPAPTQLSLFLYSVTNEPHLLLSPFLNRFPPIDSEMCPYTKYNGACLRRLGQTSLANSLPNPPSIPVDELIHFRKSQTDDMEQRPIGNFSNQVFDDKIFQLANRSYISTSLLYIPNHLDRGPLDKIIVSRIEKGRRGYNMPIIAVSASHLFPGETMHQIESHYENKHTAHPHYATANYFTRIISPAVVKLYMDSLSGHEH